MGQERQGTGEAETGSSRFRPLPDALFAGVIHLAEDAILSIDASQHIVLFNRGAERTFGYEEAEILGKPLSMLLPAKYRQAHSANVRDFAAGAEDARRMAERGTIVGLRKNGDEFPCEASICRVDLPDGPMMTVILRDITERQRGEESLRAALDEKNVLLREVHHRVKNNLQVVSSLLRLQSRATPNSYLRQAFEESQTRVQSMGLIHEQLYQSDQFSKVDFDEYVRGLARRLFRSYGVATEQVELRAAVENVSLGIDIAVPCGLILNELISNALKYAFPNERRGTIAIEMTTLSDRSVSLSVSDDGVGLPPGVGFWTTKTLGLRLVRSLVRQLDGEVELGEPPGVRVRVRFSPDAAAAESAE